MMNAPLSDFRGKRRPESVPPEPNDLVADINATLEQQVFDLPERQRIVDIQHHREADYGG